MLNGKICSICNGATGAVRCKAAPFGGLCCEDCYDRFVLPARMLLGTLGVPNATLSLLRSIAKEGRRILDQKLIERQMVRVTLSPTDDPDS